MIENSGSHRQSLTFLDQDRQLVCKEWNLAPGHGLCYSRTMRRSGPKDRVSQDQLALPVTGDGYGQAVPLMLTVKEAAALMRIGRDTTYALVAQRRIPSVKLGK